MEGKDRRRRAHGTNQDVETVLNHAFCSRNGWNADAKGYFVLRVPQKEELVVSARDNTKLQIGAWI